MDCSICCETLNKTTRKKIICPYCRFVSCLACFRRYLMGTINMDCMSCHHNLHISFIYNVTPKVFYNREYRRKRADDLFEREKSLLPQSQDAVKIELRCREIKDEIALDNKLINELHQKIDYTRNNMGELIRKLLFIDPHHYYDEIRKLKNTIQRKREEIRRLRDHKTPVIHKKNFIMPCPANDCRGFLSEEYRCE